MAVDLEYFGVPPADSRQIENRTRLVATAGQTTFSAFYTVGAVDVIYNGATLDPFTEFSGTDGANIVLATGASQTGDIVQVISRAQIAVSNTYTQQQVNALASNYYGIATGTGDAQIVVTNPVFTAYSDGMVVRIRAVAANTSNAPTIAPNGLPAKTVVRDGQIVLTGGDWTTNSEITVRYIQSIDKFLLVDGMLTATTPTQFDASSKYATTLFVQRQGLQASTFISTTGTTTLNATCFGATVNIAGSGAYSVTLPLASTAVVGTRIEFQSNNASSCSINRQGTDIINLSGGSNATGIGIGAGDTVTLECVISGASGTWLLVGGSIQLKFANAFLSGIGGAGYQKLPSGVIWQWGGATTLLSGDTFVTFPISFPNAILSITFGSSSITSAAGFVGGNTLSNGGFFINGWSTAAASTRATVSALWMAIGY
jgi:hypothetical protein